jgi:hypothetical protein
MVWFCDYGNEPFWFRRIRGFLNELSNNQLPVETLEYGSVRWGQKSTKIKMQIADENLIISRELKVLLPKKQRHTSKYSVWINYCCSYNRQFLCHILYLQCLTLVVWNKNLLNRSLVSCVVTFGVLRCFTCVSSEQDTVHIHLSSPRTIQDLSLSLLSWRIKDDYKWYERFLLINLCNPSHHL